MESRCQFCFHSLNFIIVGRREATRYLLDRPVCVLRGHTLRGLNCEDGVKGLAFDGVGCEILLAWENKRGIMRV